MKLRKVGRDVVKYEKNGEPKKRKFSYRDVVYDEDKWVDAKKFLPADFDLMFLKTKDKTYPGWSSGVKWDGLNVPKNLEVLYWKRQD